MPKPVSEWTEDDVLALPLGENDGFERKGAKALDLTLGIKPDDVLNEMAGTVLVELRNCFYPDMELAISVHVR